MFLDDKINNYLKELSSNKPTPGGGSAAALVGALGAALLNKVANFTAGKEKYREAEAEIQVILSSSRKYCKEFEKLIDEDAFVYGEVAAAYKLPKESEEEKKVRISNIRKALKNALQVPLAICRTSGEAIKLCRPLLEKGNTNLASDVGVAAEFLNSAFQAALLNVEINLTGIKDHAFTSEIKSELLSVEKETIDIRNEVIKKTKDLF